MAGCALAAEGAAPAMEMWTVEPAGWDDTARSVAAGERLPAPRGSQLCDALLAPIPGAMTFAVNGPRVKGGVVVDDAQVMAAMRFAFLHLKLVVEPGGAVALAALLAGMFDAKGRVVIATLSGGNVDAGVFARALAA
jgi:threonine dehydratase